jgi:hypothetical protein
MSPNVYYSSHSSVEDGRGVLQIPTSDMLRLRWNPFYPYMERRLLEFVRLARPESKAVFSR